VDDQMNAAQARDHIEMVDRILAQSDQSLCAGAEYFIVWGLYSGIAVADWQLVNNGVLPMTALWLQAALLVAAIIFSVVRGRATKAARARYSIVQREFFNVLWLSIGLAFVANVAAFHVFSGWAQAAIWSFAEAIVLLFIALHGNRRAMLGGIAVVVSLIAANFVPGNLMGYVLALGLVAGYAGFGIAELLARE
jgi:hypothetical protein